ncbi:MAG: hypothetical protein D6696_08115 [Acidobacteria bacterium]|nr:MAG: hypothetical protein D6696_08115 [Acidobacteriota bacterium]
MDSTTRPRSGSGRSTATPPAQAGLSLLEVLFAALLVSAVAVSIAPLFIHAVRSNVRGDMTSRALNHARSLIDVQFGKPKDHPDLSVADPSPGADPTATSRRVLEVYYDRGDPTKEGDERWLPAPPSESSDTSLALAARRPWNLQIEVQNFSIADIGGAPPPVDPSQPIVVSQGNKYLFDSPLPADAPLSFQHLKELRATVTARRSFNALASGAGGQITVRRYRAY